MTITEAINFIRPGIQPAKGTWADIGAGTGLFSQALMHLLKEGRIIAVDKSPHALFRIKALPPIHFEIREGDFHHPMDFPPLDGILMANALHYATDHLVVLKNVLTSLKPGGAFILIEYDTDIPNAPWIPNPVSLKLFQQLCGKVGLREPKLIGTRQSVYQDGRMYCAIASMTENRES